MIVLYVAAGLLVMAAVALTLGQVLGRASARYPTVEDHVDTFDVEAFDELADIDWDFPSRDVA